MRFIHTYSVELDSTRQSIVSLKDLRRIDADAYQLVESAPLPRSKVPLVHIKPLPSGHGTLPTILERFPDAMVSNRVILAMCAASSPRVNRGALAKTLKCGSEVAVYPRDILEAAAAIAMA